MVNLDSDSDSSINSDYMLDEADDRKMRSIKENRKPKQEISSNKRRTSNQGENSNLRVKTRNSPNEHKGNKTLYPKQKNEDYMVSPLISNVPKYFERKINKAMGKIIDRTEIKPMIDVNEKHDSNIKNPFSPKNSSNSGGNSKIQSNDGGILLSTDENIIEESLRKRNNVNQVVMNLSKHSAII